MTIYNVFCDNYALGSTPSLKASYSNKEAAELHVREWNNYKYSFYIEESEVYDSHEEFLINQFKV